jgi:hypothetical protein
MAEFPNEWYHKKIPSHQGVMQQTASMNALTGALDMPDFL